MAATDSEPILNGPRDDWPRLDVHLSTRLVRSLVSMGDRIVQVYPEAGGGAQEASAQWLLQRAAAEDSVLRVGAGDMVVACCSWSPHLAPLMLATIARDAIFVPLNPDQPTEDLRRLLVRLSPAAVQCEQAALRAVSAASPVQPQPLGAAAPVPAADVQRFVTQQLSRPPPKGEEARRPVIALHSSGTTGDPKTILHSQSSFSALLDVIRRKDSNYREGDVFVINTPFFWVTQVVATLMSMDFPVKVVAVKGMDPAAFRDAIQKYQATTVLTPPHVWTRLTKMEDSTHEQFRSLRFPVSSGSTLDSSKAALLHERLGLRMAQWYGTSEVLPIAGITKGERGALPPTGSVGRINAYTQARVVDVETGRTLGPGQEGELHFRGPTACNAVGPDQWFNTGDIGHYEPAGWIFVVDRVKELIKFQGIHVSPSEIESVLVSHPAVADAVVLGKPHPTDTEHPTGFVVLRPGASVTRQQLVDLVADKLSSYPYKHLRGGVHFVSSIPRTVVGKVKRANLLQTLTAQAEQTAQ
ncbi:probable 4-coumarate--CoA ligase 1 [Schistocerca nitens]|uniref:probable 4-coumarate--CoA ligase 1 n=1 Tax=Schistocerca nitens TaxID=7011 RepID=UPI00211865DB|nr:probable 4-coumarate--CoA ligase 1 [Schistocerca nitens]XP_049791442.1 probable 4-coumarate--CoA ligase 1 [Schistocerca nitens]